MTRISRILGRQIVTSMHQLAAQQTFALSSTHQAWRGRVHPEVQRLVQELLFFRQSLGKCWRSRVVLEVGEGESLSSQVLLCLTASDQSCPASFPQAKCEHWEAIDSRKDRIYR